MSRIDKRALVEAYRRDVLAEVDTLTRAAQIAHEEATHEEAKPENDKDTRSVEAAYLAGAQAERVRDLERVASALAVLPLRAFAEDEPVALAAVVEVEHKGKRSLYFVAPEGGGLRARLGEHEVQIVTPQSPLGEALVHAAVGEEIEVITPAATRIYEVLAIE